MEIRLHNNIKEFSRYLTSVQRLQVPFATSRAINDTAVNGQEAVQGEVQHIFNNRKKWWLRQQPTGIKVKFSNKQNLHAQVFTNAYFAPMQAEGGTKKPRSAHNLAIPTDAVPKKYRTSHGAREMLNSGQRVFRTSKGVFKRTGKKTLTLLWSFSPTAAIRRIFNFNEIVEKEVIKRFEGHFFKRLEQALATAKPPSL